MLITPANYLSFLYLYNIKCNRNDTIWLLNPKKILNKIAQIETESYIFLVLKQNALSNRFWVMNYMQSPGKLIFTAHLKKNKHDA